MPLLLCHARQDHEFVQRLVAHLHGFDIQDKARAWSDAELSPGPREGSALQTAMLHAKAAVLFLSEHFLASGFIRKGELMQLLEQRRNGLLLYPLIVRPCAYDRIELRFPDPLTGPDSFSLGQLTSINPGRVPLASLTAAKAEEVLETLARALSTACRSQLKRRW